MITQISQQNDSTRIVNVIRKNLGRGQNYAANVYVPVKLKKWWNIQNNLSVYFSRFDDPNLEGAKFSLHKPAFSFNTTHSFSLPERFSIEFNFWLNSPRVNGVEQTLVTQYAVNAGIQKLMLEKRLKMKFSIDDIFLTNHWEGKLVYQNVNLNVVNRYLSRRAAFTLSYNFGSQQIKSARNRNTAVEDLKSRAN
ncbi:Outer membrane protein beta-barrel family protein [compost metagenome]